MTTDTSMSGDRNVTDTQLADIAFVAPALHRHLTVTLLGEVWKRPGLSPRDRGLITLAAVIASAQDWETAVYFDKALDAGVTPLEVSELLLQIACYIGWPNAVRAALDLRPLFAARGIPPIADNIGDLLDLEPKAEAARRATVDANVGPVAPSLAADTNDLLFGEIWRRPGLSSRDRSLVTMTALIVIGQPEQLTFHANRGMDNGLSPEQAGEVLSHLAYYAGWPRAMSAVPVLKKILDDRAAR
jgi:4-carboxymuconolactone decarboxylase